MAGKVEKKVQALCARPTGLERSRKKMAVRTRGTKRSPPKKMRFGFARVANCSSPHDSTHACKDNPKFGLALRLRGEETANKNEQNHPKPLQELFFFFFWPSCRCFLLTNSARSQNSYPKYVLKVHFSILLL